MEYITPEALVINFNTDIIRTSGEIEGEIDPVIDDTIDPQ